jgi:hypothetical protein
MPELQGLIPIDCEPPDFLCDVGGSRVGIEVTRFFFPTDSHPPPQAAETKRMSLAKELREEHLKTNITPVHVSIIFFRDDALLKASQRSALKKELLAFVSQHIPPPGPAVEFDLDSLPESLLEKGVDMITIINAELTSPCWSLSYASTTNGMKIKIAILVFGCVSATAQDSLVNGGNFIGTGSGSYVEDLARQKAYQAKLEHDFVPKDPWREIDGKTNYAKAGWVQFTGEIVAVKPYGIWVKGGYGKPPFSENFRNEEGREFFVKNYPYQGAYGDNLSSSQNLTAKESGVFTFTNTTGGTTTIHQLDYGVPCGPPQPTPEQLGAIKLKQQLDKQRTLEGQTNAVHWLQSQATNGDVSAQCSLGLHYLNGLGCETNKEQAIFWLQKAAEQGDSEASNKLSELKLP